MTSVQPQPLRVPRHPGQSDTLVHFCGRARPSTSPDVANLTAPQRLDSILRTGVLRAFPPYGRPWPVVCFSESDSGGVEALLRYSDFQPWGVVVRRDWVWANGGGPVWYVRDDVTPATVGLDERALSWLVPTTPQHNDWLHEREWRLPMTHGNTPGIGLGDGVIAILVGDRRWEPGPVAELEVDPTTGHPAIAEMTPRQAVVPRWYWDGTRIHLLQPVPIRIAGYHPL